MKCHSKIVLTLFATTAVPFAALCGKGATNSAMLLPPPVALNGQGCSSNAAQSAVMYINHLNFVVAKLGKMNDLCVLQQEYENLTDNNLNLTTIQDELIVQLVVELMDALKELQKDNVKILKAQCDFEREKDAAIWSAIPQPAIFIAAVNPVTLAIAVGGAALTSIQNYHAAVARAEGKYNDKLFDAGNGKLDHINEINKELFLAQWRLMKKYGVREGDRITRADSELFLGFAEVLKGKPDVSGDLTLNKVVRDIFKNHENEMGGLPFYWITRASASKKLHDYDDIRYCCESYFKLYGATPIIRRDMDACAMALLYVATTMDCYKKNVDKGWVRSWLKFVEDTVRIPEWQTKYCVAMLYRKIGDENKAQEVLYKTLLEVYACINVWERSGKNIFRTTPALEKAYECFASTNVNVKSGMEQKLPNWEAEAKVLVPYTGYVWLSGALYASGSDYKDLYDRLKVCPAVVGVSVNYVQGKYQMHRPSIRKVGDGKYMMFLNGCAEKNVADGDVKVFCSKGDVCSGIGPFDWPTGEDKVVLGIRTKHGIVAKFAFAKDNLTEPCEEKIWYPWSEDK